jgi:hypothetical protein
MRLTEASKSRDCRRALIGAPIYFKLDPSPEPHRSGPRSGFGTSRHFAGAQQFGRYQGIADSDERSARQIYGFTSFLIMKPLQRLVAPDHWLAPARTDQMIGGLSGEVSSPRRCWNRTPVRGKGGKPDRGQALSMDVNSALMPECETRRPSAPSMFKFMPLPSATAASRTRKAPPSGTSRGEYRACEFWRRVQGDPCISQSNLLTEWQDPSVR